MDIQIAVFEHQDLLGRRKFSSRWQFQALYQQHLLDSLTSQFAHSWSKLVKDYLESLLVAEYLPFQSSATLATFSDSEGGVITIKLGHSHPNLGQIKREITQILNTQSPVKAIQQIQSMVKSVKSCKDRFYQLSFPEYPTATEYAREQEQEDTSLENFLNQALLTANVKH